MVPTIKARNTIMKGSITEVRLFTALSTSCRSTPVVTSNEYVDAMDARYL